MKMRRTTLAVCSTLLLLGLTNWAITSGPFRDYYPTDSTKSEFIKNYTPAYMQEVMKPFVSRDEQTLTDSGAGAGKQFVNNQCTIERYFAVEPEMIPRLVAALSDDIAAQLTHDGGKLMSKTGDYRSGILSPIDRVTTSVPHVSPRQ